MKLTSKKEFKKPESFDELLLDDPFGLLANVGLQVAELAAGAASFWYFHEPEEPAALQKRRNETEKQ